MLQVRQFMGQHARPLQRAAHARRHVRAGAAELLRVEVAHGEWRECGHGFQYAVPGWRDGGLRGRRGAKRGQWRWRCSPQARRLGQSLQQVEAAARMPRQVARQHRTERGTAMQRRDAGVDGEGSVTQTVVDRRAHGVLEG